MTGDRALVALALEARKNAYVPYSHYAVGAAVETADGKQFAGCNIENASYSATCCAERTAVFKAVSEGERSIVTLALAAAPQACEAPLPSYAVPCGICLQVLSEFGAPELRLLLAKSEQDYRICTLRDIMPMRFTAADLEAK